MIKLYPESALTQLEFDKIKLLLVEHCKTAYAKAKAENLRIHTRKDYIDIELRQTYEYKLLLLQAQYFPNDFSLNLSKEIKLLGIPGATLKEDELMDVKRLAENMSNIFRWFDAERRMAYSSLAQVIEHSYYEKAIQEIIEVVLDEHGSVKDNASADLQKIRMNLYKKRNELRRTFEKVLQK
jgi:DNA mismatch repair protein MutS2